MSHRAATAAFAVAGLIASYAVASAMTGIGCPDLPEYYRAVGTIENGEGSCGMSMAEAKRILARQSGPDAAPQPEAPAKPRKHHRHKTTHKPRAY